MMFKRIHHVEIVTDQLDRTVQFYTEVLGFTVKARDRIERSGLGVPINLVYLDLGGTVVELISYEGVTVDPAPQTEHLGYRMIALEVDDMQRTADYLATKGVDIVWGPRVRETYSRAEICDPTAITSSSGSGSDEPMCSRQAGCSGTVRREVDSNHRSLGKENCIAAPFRQTFLNSSSAVMMRRIIIPLMRFGRLMRRAGLFDRYTP
jgi:catechol 2,3-dioxygenase-like lactoylglutathione lyase family enzyme